ncbi:MAG: alanine racemase [bacterium]
MHIDRRLRKLEKPFKTLNRVEVSRAAVLHNFDIFQSLMPSGSLIPVLKANAYGHGLVQIAEILKGRSFPYIAVDGYFEALHIRQVSPQPILVMGAIMPENFKSIRFKDFTFVVHDQQTIQALADTGKKMTVHIELETGMSRHGISLEKLPGILNVLQKYPKLRVEGVMSHLADSDNPDEGFTKAQATRFDEGVEIILAHGFTPTLFHLAQTAGSAKPFSKHANAIRPGIGLYGMNPLEESDPQYSKLTGLKPALTLKSTVTKIVEVESGETVSYSRTFKAKKSTRIGVIPVGYYEGLPRALSNKGSVLCKGKPLPIAGRINMNHTMVDLGDLPVEVGDEIAVLGGDAGTASSIQTLTKDFGLFPYETLVHISESIRRVIV